MSSRGVTGRLSAATRHPRAIREPPSPVTAAGTLSSRADTTAASGTPRTRQSRSQPVRPARQRGAGLPVPSPARPPGAAAPVPPTVRLAQRGPPPAPDEPRRTGPPTNPPGAPQRGPERNGRGNGSTGPPPGDCAYGNACRPGPPSHGRTRNAGDHDGPSSPRRSCRPHHRSRSRPATPRMRLRMRRIIGVLTVLHAMDGRPSADALGPGHRHVVVSMSTTGERDEPPLYGVIADWIQMRPATLSSMRHACMSLANKYSSDTAI